MSAFSIRVDKDKAPAMKASGWSRSMAGSTR